MEKYSSKRPKNKARKGSQLKQNNNSTQICEDTELYKYPCLLTHPHQSVLYLPKHKHDDKSFLCLLPESLCFSWYVYSAIATQSSTIKSLNVSGSKEPMYYVGISIRHRRFMFLMLTRRMNVDSSLVILILANVSSTIAYMDM